MRGWNRAGSAPALVLQSREKTKMNVETTISNRVLFME